MKKNAFVTLALLISGHALAAKPCDELLNEISAKITASGAKGFELAIVSSDKVGDSKVVGSCDRGTKKITYARK